MISRREFLRSSGALGSAIVTTGSAGLGAIVEAGARVADQSPEAVAQDELYWGQIQQAFSLDRNVINLNSTVTVCKFTVKSKRSVRAVGCVADFATASCDALIGAY